MCALPMVIYRYVIIALVSDCRFHGHDIHIVALVVFLCVDRIVEGA